MFLGKSRNSDSARQSFYQLSQNRRDGRIRRQLAKLGEKTAANPMRVAS